MRINEANRYNAFRQEQPAVRQAKQNTVSSGAATDTDPSAPQDIVVISTENTQRSKEEVLANQQQAAAKEIDEMIRLLESAKAQSVAEKESAEVKRKCLLIAARIIAGDEVPRKDHRYLAKHDLGLYCRAISMRVVREKARRHRAISDDEGTKNKGNPFSCGNKESSLSDAVDTISAAPAAQSDITV